MMHKIMGAEDFELEWCYEQCANGKASVSLCICGFCICGFCALLSL